MTTQSSNNEDILEFVGSVCAADPTRIEADLGHGYVKLKSSEAERRQAQQDIRCSEDILLELLRNSRDANAKNIFVAIKREGDVRTIVIIDDGEGIPEDLKDKIFDARVTSKLDTAHMDKWGMHGRGMALFSIRSNSTASNVVDTGFKLGTSIRIETSIDTLGEKTDQTTFPHFEMVDGTYSMRGPKNMLRCAAEFSFAHKDDINVYLGSFSEIAYAMYCYGKTRVPLTKRTFSTNVSGVALIDRLAFAHDPSEFKDICTQLGIDISERSARRILDGEIDQQPSLFERIVEESFPKTESGNSAKTLKKASTNTKESVRIDKSDMQAFVSEVLSCFDDLAEKYYLDSNIDIETQVRDGALKLSIPLRRSE